MKQLISHMNMVQKQLKTFHVIEASILDLYLSLPRDQFVPSRYLYFAYSDMPIPLMHDQEMLPPKEEAFLMQSLQIKPSDTVLEIGTCSGYVTALLAKQALQVESVDVHPDFTQHAAEKLANLRLDHVVLMTGNALDGWQAQEKYHIIWINGSLPFLSQKLLNQLHEGGRLAAVVGNKENMQAVIVKRVSKRKWTVYKLFETWTPRSSAYLLSKKGRSFVF